MKIDSSLEASKENFINDFKLEAVLFDSGTWDNNNHESHVDLLSSNVANVKLTLLPGTALGFHGYVLGGRLEKPRLWSAEQVLEIPINLLVSLSLSLSLYVNFFGLPFPLINSQISTLLLFF